MKNKIFDLVKINANPNTIELITYENNLKDFLDSLDFLNLLLDIENELNIPNAQTVFSNSSDAVSINDIADYAINN